jgi:capsular polysaccharide export protein
VSKINFNGGDWLFYPSGAMNFPGRLEDWPAYFEAALERLRIDVVLLFGDCRPIHRVAHEIAHRRHLRIGVFEEGYIRPDYVTLEQFGVNNHSSLPRLPGFYRSRPAYPMECPARVQNAYWFAALWAILYYLAADLARPAFAHYVHHRPLSWKQSLPWIRSIWRKVRYAVTEHAVIARLCGPLKESHFLVPLQVPCDAQVISHSDFASIQHFIETVMASFAMHAPRETVLVFKHHPMDRGDHDYARWIKERSRRWGLQGRCIYIHDQHLPTLLQCARGVVVINSTVGLSALHHGTALKVCGSAIFDMPGLTFQGSLDEFWTQAREARPDALLLQRFQGYLVHHTQINGSFYTRLRASRSATGLEWIACDKHSHAIGAQAGRTAQGRVVAHQNSIGSQGCGPVR